MSLLNPGWPLGKADRVYSKVKSWVRGYEFGIPHKPKGVPHPDRPDDMILVVNSYKHNIAFRLNELQWLEDVLGYATEGILDSDPKRVVYGVIKKAREQHEKCISLGRVTSGNEYAQPYLFDKSHVVWIYNTLGLLENGRLKSIADIKKETEEKKSW
jgi:hypothetical protein